MAKYKIADFITEFTPQYDRLKSLAKPFLYNGQKNDADIKLYVTQEHLNSLIARMEKNTPIENAEEFAYASAFNRAIIKHNAMLVHSSAIVYEGNAYLFSAPSGVGKSTHTKLWMKAFGADKVKIINDDKPVVRVFENKCIAFGTPFDGGSGIAVNESAPLKAIVFLKRGEHNAIRKATTKDVIENLYISTAHFVDKATAVSMLSNFEQLINYADFYILTCNTDISAAYTAHDTICQP